MKKKMLLLVAFLAVIIAAVVFVSTGGTETSVNTEPSDDDFVVFTVDGEPVTFREFYHSVNHVRGGVIASYIVAGLDFGCPDFWHTYVDGITPFQTLKQQAVQRAARIKVIQIQAMEYELIDDISYSAFMSGFIQENERREGVVDSGGVIFGPQQYGESLFFDIQTTNLEDALRSFIAPLMGATEEELLEFFEEDWQNTPAEAGWIIIDKLYIPYMPTGYLFREEAYALLQDVLVQAQRGEDFMEIAEEHSSVMFREQFLSLRRGEGSLGQRASIQTARDMRIGELSSIYSDNGSLAILLVTARNEERFLTFEDLWSVMQRTKTVQNFAQFIDSFVEEANIIINYEVVDELKVLITNLDNPNGKMGEMSRIEVDGKTINGNILPVYEGGCIT